MIFEFQSVEGNIIEKSFRIGKCPEKIIVDNIEYIRIYSTPYVIMDSNKPKTIDDLAHKNTDRMEKEGTLPKQPETKKPWWRQNKKKPKSFKGMTKQQISRYIERGD